MKSINRLINQLNEEKKTAEKKKATSDRLHLKEKNSEKYNQVAKKSTPNKSASSVSKSKPSLGNDLKAVTRAATQFFNPFDDVSAKDAVNNFIHRDTSNTFDEIARGSNRLVDSASLGAMSNLDKRVNNRDPYYNSERKFGEGGGTDLITSGLGYLAPGIGAVKGVKALGLGAKTVKELPKLAKDASKMEKVMRAVKGGSLVGKELAKEGAIVGGAMGLAEVGIREGLNPDDYNWKQNLSHVGFGAVTGAVADPLLHGVGKGLSKGAESVANRTMKNLLPDNAQVGKNLGNTLKTFEAERVPVQDFPNMSNTPKPSALNDLLPQANDIANPNIVRPLATVKPQEPIVNSPYKRFDGVEQPKIETPIQEPTPITFKRTETVSKEPNERSMYNTFKNSTKTTDEVRERLDKMDTTYQQLSNKELVEKANDLVKTDIEQAYQFVKNAEKMDARHTTVAFRLIDELQAKGEHERALDLVERVAEYGTKAGQSVQALSIYNRLSPQGQLIRFQRAVNKMNAKAGVNAPKVEITEDLQKSIVATAESIQQLTGQEQLGKNVIDIVEKLKKGQAATDEETQMIKNFFEDAKKFVSDLDPKAKPQKVAKIKDVRTRDKVVDIMSKREEESKKALKQLFNRANSLPVDAFYHLSVVGASKIAKGAVKFADFSEQMIKEFGETIKPYIQQIYNKSVETFNLQSTKMTPKKLTDAEKVVNKALKDEKLTEEQAKEINDLLKQVLEATEGKKFEANLELQAALNDLQRPTFGQKVSVFQTMMQLFNPLTMERNIIGNEAFYRIDRASKLLLAAPFDKARVTVFGGKRHIIMNSGQFNWKTFFQPTKDYWKGLKMGAKAGWKGVNPFGLQSAYDIRPQTFKSKANPLHWMEKALGATLRGFDTAGYMRAYNGTLRELATLRAVNEGLKGKALRESAEQYMRELDENMINIADEYGKYATFQDNTALSDVLSTVKRWMNFNKEFGLGDLILKYPKTPGNLIMRAIEYSPAGVMRSAAFLHKFYKHRNPQDIVNFEMSLARAIMGTVGFSGLGYILADKGVLTTKGSSDYETSMLERQAGKQPNSINWTAIQRFISGFNLDELETRKGDTFISYDWMQPIAVSVAIGAGINQSIKEEKEINPYQAAKTGVSSAFDTVINMSVLQGLKSFLTTYPGQDETDRVAGAVEGLASSFVPTLSNQVRKLTDNNARETYDPEFMGNMKNKAVNRIPSLEKALPQSYDTLGNPRKLYQNGSNNIGNVFFNPSYVSQYNPTSEQEFLLDYINKTKETEVSPRVPKKYIGDVKLNGEQWSEFKRIQGEETLKGLQKILPRLQGETNDEKIRKEIKKQLDKAGERARKEMLSKVGE